MNKSNLLLVLFICAISFFSCEEKDDITIIEKNQISDTILKVDKFINDYMSEYYLWTEEMPSIDYTKQSDPYAYFDSLLYIDDKWSWLTDDYEGLMDYLSGTETSYGYSLAFGLFSNTDNYFAIVKYVDKNTPAERAGLVRGDIIINIDGASINDDNYRDLFYSSSMTITLGVLTDTGIAKGKTVSMTSEELETDPVLMSKVIELKGNKRVGYLVYTQYLHEYNYRLDEVFSEFKSAGITDLVLDLRYNGGGYITSAVHLCSSIAPSNVVNSEGRMVDITWNETVKEYYLSNNQSDKMYENFDKSVSSNLNLNRLFVLATNETASASEMTIASLMPYMDVVIIGDSTSGKYTASSTFQPIVYNKYSGKEELDRKISNWAMQPIIYKWANVDGLTDFKNGLAPDYLVDDQLLPAYPLGDLSEPLLRKAIDLIGDPGVVALKSAEDRRPSKLKYTLVDMPKSVNERLSKNLIHNLEIRQ